jgi:hypothetical protein
MTSPNTIIADIQTDIATLEQENRQVRARLERVEKERNTLLSALLPIAERGEISAKIIANAQAAIESVRGI